MKTAEFNKVVEVKKKEILNGNAEVLFSKLKHQDEYRSHGIDGLTFDEILTEIAQAEVLGVCFVDDLDINKEIEEL
jgi:hypothetical protein